MIYTQYLKSVIAGSVLAFLIFLLAVFYQMEAPTETSRTTYEITQLKTSFAKSIQQPKLIVTGGSNVLFGISCQKIYQETNIFCVNAGTGAGLGLSYNLRYAESLANSGDTILLAFEYALYNSDSDMLIDYVLARDPAYLQSLDLVKKVNFIANIPLERLIYGVALQIKPFKIGSSTYDSKYVNEYGDYTNNIITQENRNSLAQLLKNFSPISLMDYQLSNSARKDLEQFVEHCQEQKINVIATWPNTLWFEEYKQPSSRKLLETIQDFYKSWG